MKKVLGTLALMAVSAIAFAMPAAAAEQNGHNYGYQQPAVHEQAVTYRNDRGRDDRRPVAVVREDRRAPVRVIHNYRPVNYRPIAECR